MKITIKKQVGDARLVTVIEDQDADAVVYALEAMGYAVPCDCDSCNPDKPKDTVH